MFVQQLYTGCLSEAAYFIESHGEAAVIDPIRDIDLYIALAKERNATIKYIFETHFHADFVSGHLDLSKAAKAPVVYGPGAETAFDVIVATDGQLFSVGNITLEVLHTPGHTLESSCFLLRDENRKPHAVFTGDTLFVGDVGRPDLAQKAGNHSKEDLAGLLYQSLQSKILTLPDDVIVYPAHGAGSSCGKNLGKETFSTIGEERLSNYALNQPDKAAFVKAVTDGLSDPPVYFPLNVAINKKGYKNIDLLISEGMKPMDAGSFKNAIGEDEAVALDTRAAVDFTQGFVPGSINIGLEGRFAEWAASLIGLHQPIYLITDKGKERESIVRLARVGFDNVKGYLAGGFDAWRSKGEEMDMIIDIEADELAMDLPFDENAVVVDVRKESEFNNGHLKEAVNLPLHSLTDPGTLSDFEEHHNLYLHCQGGYRSVIAASIFKRQGIHNLRNVLGGWAAMEKLEKLNERIEKN